MSKPPTHALSDILDRLERLADGAELAISDVVDAMGSSSFASLMLVFALIAASPASTDGSLFGRDNSDRHAAQRS